MKKIKLKDNQKSLIIDGQRIILNYGRDINKDGTIQQTEIANVHGDNDVIIPQQKSETREGMDALNEDIIDAENFSSIDFKSRIPKELLGCIVAIEGGVIYNALPSRARIIVRSFKRHLVSINGIGREELIKLQTGIIEKEANRKGFLGKLGGLFGIGKE